MDAAFSRRRGRVAVFDDQVGAGTIIDDRGDIWWFHCTAISTGTRQISVDERVMITIGTGPNGLEAVEVDPRRTDQSGDAESPAGEAPPA